MRVLIAPDGFGGTLTAEEAASAVRAGWLRAAPGDDVRACPLSDGGPGFLDTLRASLGGELVALTVRSPVGRPVPAALLLVDAADGSRTAYVESSHAVGLPLVPTDRRDPMRATSFGVGQLVRAAVDSGAVRIVVGLGGSATNDAGAGMLAALGVGDPDGLLAGGGAALGSVTRDDLAGLAGLRQSLRHIDLVAAVDVDVPLLGLQGASAGFAPQKGATPEQAQQLERALGQFAHTSVGALGDVVRPDLLASAQATSPITRLAAQPGAGAAGGLGFGLALIGARLVPGSDLVADAVSLTPRIADVDLVVTGEGMFDWQSLHGKVVAAVAERALTVAVPTIVVAGQVQVGRRELAAAGITAAYAVADGPDEVAAALADPAGTLSRRSERVARTWSR
jgi:glycerate kinase